MNRWETRALPDKSPRQQERRRVLHPRRCICQSLQTSTAGEHSAARGLDTAKGASRSGTHTTQAAAGVQTGKENG